MIYEAELVISAEEVNNCQDLLDCKKVIIHNDDVVKTYTAQFRNGYEADIKVVDSKSPYVDPVLFDEDGMEVMCIEVRDKLCGEYKFNHNDNVYIVNVVKSVEVDSIPF